MSIAQAQRLAQLEAIVAQQRAQIDDLARRLALLEQQRTRGRSSNNG